MVFLFFKLPLRNSIDKNGEYSTDMFFQKIQRCLKMATYVTDGLGIGDAKRYHKIVFSCKPDKEILDLTLG